MSASPSPLPAPTSLAAAVVPKHWTPEQALAVAECLQALRQALWAAYGPRIQQAWREHSCLTRRRLSSIPTPF